MNIILINWNYFCFSNQITILFTAKTIYFSFLYDNLINKYNINHFCKIIK